MGMLKQQGKYTPSLPGMQRLFIGRKRLSVKEKLQREIEAIKKSQLPEFRQLFSSHIPVSLFNSFTSHNARNRIFNLEITFWTFLNQIFLSGTSCREMVKKVQSWMIRLNKPLPSSNTSAYCQARSKLSLEFLSKIFNHTAKVLEDRFMLKNLWHGHNIKVIDGSGLSAPDTKANQKEYPQNGAMKVGCGFPQITFLGLFSLSNGTLLNWKIGSRFVSENKLWKKMWSTLSPGDVILGDRGFCTYANIASLLKLKVDSIYRLHQARKINWKEGRKLGKKDAVFTWIRPKFLRGWPKKELLKLPEETQVRILELPILKKGFRTQKILLTTTLLDAEKYTPEELAELYFKRWSVELFLRDIKTSMGMDILTSLTPEQIQKEITMHTICYNLIRGFMQDAAELYSIPVDTISFKGTVQQFNQWIWVFLKQEYTPVEFRNIMVKFYEKIADDPISKRPGRSEPRARKRRPKNYNLMNKPRHQMVVDCHRTDTKRKNALFRA